MILYIKYLEKGLIKLPSWLLCYLNRVDHKAILELV